MARFIIPLSNQLPSFRFLIDLGDEVFEFVFRYNTRVERWTFDVYNSEKEKKYVGTLYAVGPEGDPYLDATRWDIGRDIKLYYDDGQS
jgi:hypothetical protein